MSDQTAPFFASGKHPVRRSGRTEDRTQTYTFVHGCLKILAQIDFSISNNTSASSVCKDREGGWFFIIIDKDHKSNVFPLGGECWVLFWTVRKEAVHSWSYTVNTQWYQTKIGPEFPALKLFGECATCQKENARPQTLGKCWFCFVKLVDFYSCVVVLFSFKWPSHDYEPASWLHNRSCVHRKEKKESNNEHNWRENKIHIILACRLPERHR